MAALLLTIIVVRGFYISKDVSYSWCIILSVLRLRKDILYDLFAEVLEDMAMVNAIREGESTGTVSREEVFQVLDG